MRRRRFANETTGVDALSWAPNLDDARRAAREQWRFAALGTDRLWDLRTPAEFADATRNVTSDQLADKNPDVGESSRARESPARIPRPRRRGRILSQRRKESGAVHRRVRRARAAGCARRPLSSRASRKSYFTPRFFFRKSTVRGHASLVAARFACSSASSLVHRGVHRGAKTSRSYCPRASREELSKWF